MTRIMELAYPKHEAHRREFESLLEADSLPFDFWDLDTRHWDLGACPDEDGYHAWADWSGDWRGTPIIVVCDPGPAGESYLWEWIEPRAVKAVTVDWSKVERERRVHTGG